MGWEVFSKNFQFKVGVWNKVKFWTDRVVWGSSSPFSFFGLVQFYCKQSGFCRLIFDMPRSGGWENLGCLFHLRS